MKRADKRPHVMTALRLKGRLSRLPLFGVGKTGQELGGLVSRARRREDRLAVGFEDAEPVTDIFGMVRTRLCGDTKIAAEKCRAKLGHHLFHRIGIVAKAFAERAITTR